MKTTQIKLRHLKLTNIKKFHQELPKPK